MDFAVARKTGLPRNSRKIIIFSWHFVTFSWHFVTQTLYITFLRFSIFRLAPPVAGQQNEQFALFRHEIHQNINNIYFVDFAWKNCFPDKNTQTAMRPCLNSCQISIIVANGHELANGVWFKWIWNTPKWRSATKVVKYHGFWWNLGWFELI